jgi:hypothetical protein
VQCHLFPRNLKTGTAAVMAVAPTVMRKAMAGPDNVFCSMVMREAVGAVPKLAASTTAVGIHATQDGRALAA